MEGMIKDLNYAEDKWAKMEHVHHINSPWEKVEKVVVHYWKEIETGFKTGFKFK